MTGGTAGAVLVAALLAVPAAAGQEVPTTGVTTAPAARPLPDPARADPTAALGWALLAAAGLGSPLLFASGRALVDRLSARRRPGVGEGNGEN